MADAVRKNDAVARRIEKLPRSKQFGSKDGREKLMASDAGAVKNQNRIRDAALRIARRLAQRGVVQAQFRQRFARPKFEIFDDEIAFGSFGRLSCLTRRWQAHQEWERRCQQDGM